MKHLSILFFLLFSATLSHAQITITADEFIKEDTGHISSKAYNQDSINVPKVGNSLLALIAISGAGVTWDFGGIVGFDFNQYSTATTTTYLPYPGGAALAEDPDFTGATFVAKYTPKNPSNPTFYGFYKFDSTGFWTYGETRQDSNGTKSKIISYVPPLQTMKFPLTYGTSWHSFSNIYDSFEPKGTIYRDTAVYVVDSWGTFISPTTVPPSTKSSNNSIRLKSIDIQTIDSAGLGIKITIFKVDSYGWLTNTGYGAGINRIEGSYPYNASYSEGVQNSVKELSNTDNMMILRVTPNPAAGSEMKISCTLKNESNLEVNLFDAVGRNVQTIMKAHSASGENIIPFDQSQLPNGTYFLRVGADGMTATSKIIIQK